LNRECRPVADFEVEVACMLTKGLCVDSREVDLTLVLLSDFLKLGGQRFTLLWSLGEDVAERETRLNRAKSAN